MTETLGEFRTDLGLCANTVIAENTFSVDVPSHSLENAKANVCPPHLSNSNFSYFV